MPEEISPTCLTCNGSGYVGNDICLECMGSGILPLRGMNLYLKKMNVDILSKFQEIKTKQNTMQADINYIKGKVG